MPDTSVVYDNLAGTVVFKDDGNLTPEATAIGPRAFVIGTASQGRGSIAYLVPTTTQAKSEFGTDGTLLRGMWEAKAMGANEIALYRIGARAATLSGVGNSAGGAGGYTIQTVSEDADAGGDYALYYDDSEDRLVVIRNSDELVVFDNDETTPIERYEVTVSGYRASGGGPDIGSPSSFIDLEDVDPSTYAGTSFEAGDDGLGLSRMELYEKLYVAYEHIKEYDFDVIIPMDIYLDDYNVVAQGHYLGAVTPVSPTANVYPTPGRYRPGLDVDALGRVFVEEYEGEYFFWWWFNSGAGVFASANMWPAAAPGSASATTKIDGTALAAADFHEVNFGYQLGRFLYEYSTNIVDATGVIGALPPASGSLTDRSRWTGVAPTLTLDTATGDYYIASSGDNGTGLLGNKFMAGRNDWRSGANGGGFIATESKWMDDTEILDNNDIAVDLGKYFNVVPEWVLLRNSYSQVSYQANWAASYGGFYINRSPASAPTNKKVSRTSLIYGFGLQDRDNLAGAGYTVLRQKSTGLVVADAPTAALSTSDFTRLSTVRIVKAVVDGVRAAVDPFLGESLSDPAKASLQNKIETVLMNAKKAGFLKDFRPFEIIQTPDMEVAGQATINLTLIPAFELRQVTVTVSVSKSG